MGNIYSSQNPDALEPNNGCVQPAPAPPSKNADRKLSEIVPDMQLHFEIPKPNKKIGIAVIGIGSRLASLLGKITMFYPEVFEVRGFSDESPEALKLAAERWAGVECFQDYNQMLLKKGSEIEWVLIGSRNSLHRDHCIASFQAGKNVFCEKPLAITIEQCVEIREAQRKANRLFATGFVLRHAPLYRAVKNVITSGRIGNVISIEANEMLSAGHGGYIMRNWRRYREQSGGHMLEKCCHDIDILNWLCDSLPTRVASFGGLDVFTPAHKPTDEKTVRQYKTWSQAWEDIDPFTSEKTIVDNQVVILEYRNRVRVTFHANSNSGIAQRRMMVCGTSGSIEVDLVEGTLHIRRIDDEDDGVHYETKRGAVHGGADDIIVVDLCHSMANQTPPKATGEEGFRSAVVCLAIDQAMQEGKIVDLEPLWKKFVV